MISLPGYEITNRIYEGKRFLIYGGYRKSDNHRVAIKLLKEEYPAIDMSARLKREYEIFQKLQGEGTITAFGLEQYQNGLVLVFEEFGTQSLKQLLAEKQINLHEFFILALNIIDALEKIHQHHIVHQNINPANILLDAENHDVKIIDFGIASTLLRERAEIVNPLLLEEEALSYMSPEQTGRMNRGIDYRTDYYSLGVIFYQMLTNELPFQSDDVIELVHYHIAKLPQLPHELNPNIPKTLANIIMKLLAKTPEDRYQSTFGLKADLQNCMEQLQLTGKIKSFPIGKKDITVKFQISEKIYGREEELKILLDAFKKASSGQAELTIIGGYAGVGKTTLVHELYKPLVENHGYFIAGKFEQYKRSVPYFSLIQAFQDFVRQILTESQPQIDIWRERIQNALNPNGQIIVDVIPMLSTLIGKQAPVPKLQPTENQNRFNIVFQRFIHALAQPDHPLVLFLDDCQWADLPSLKLLETFLLHPDSRNALIIGAYRDNEVDQHHVLTESLDILKKAGFEYKTIVLKPLELVHIKELLADTLHCNKTMVESLAQICYEKTQGNPFFLNQFLQILYKEELLEFNLKRGRWDWDVEKIQRKDITNNVVELMVKKIEKLSPSTQKVLQLSACLGNRFDLQILAMLHEKSSKDTAKDLWEALTEGLIVPIDATYKYAIDIENSNSHYQFLHDRVQQAAYSLIDPAKCKQIHLKIGRLMFKHAPNKNIGEEVMEIVNQLNKGTDLLTDADEKSTFSELNLIAAKKAKTSIAYKAALSYLKKGIDLLASDCWKEQYQLALSLHTEAVETAYLATEFAEMEKYNDIVIKNAHDLLDKIKIYEIKIIYLTNQNRVNEALQVALFVLRLLGINLPDHPGKIRILRDLLRLKILLMGKKIDDLFDLPQMTNPYYQAAIRIMWRMQGTAYIVNPKLFLLTVLECIRLSIKYGNTYESPVNYASYAIVLCAVHKDVNAAKQFVELSLRLMDRYNVEYIKPQIWMTIGAFVMHWYDPINKTFPVLVNGFQIALEVGDIALAGWLATCYATLIVLSGKEITNSLKEMEKYAKYLRLIRQMNAYQYIAIYLQTYVNLSGKIPLENATQLVGDWFDERVLLPKLIEKKDVPGITITYLAKLMLCYLFQDFKQAYVCAMQALQYTEKAVGASYIIPVFHLFNALTCLACYRDSTDSERKKLLYYVEKSQKKLKQYAKLSPDNYLNKYYLIEAEKSRILGNKENAENFFDRSISLSKENQFLHEEAMGNELAAKYYLECDRENIAKIYINDAYSGYLKWGAIGKAKQLEQTYSSLLQKEERYTAVYQEKGQVLNEQPSKTFTEIVDIVTVMKTAQTISRETDFSVLIRKMMHILIGSAGAQKGFLLLQNNQEWHIEAECSIGQDKITVLQSVPINEDLLPVTIIKQAINDKKPIVLNNKTDFNQFSHDPYIKRIKPKSVLCYPLLNQGLLTGILYLENDLAFETFTQERIELLNLLCGEIVIAIDNAKLFSHMKALNKAYERFVPKKFIKLLNKKNIIDVKLGDHVQKEMIVMFCDIRRFSTISEKLTSEKSLAFINTFLQHMSPIVSKYHGFIDKYIGDGFIALFPTNADDALQCAIEMMHELNRYNEERIRLKQIPINIGIGLNTGTLALGTIGNMHRMQSIALSAAVNIASSVEELSKTYFVPLIITDEIYKKLENQIYAIRKLDKIVVDSRVTPLTIYEVFDCDPELLIVSKKKTLIKFEKGIKLFQHKKYNQAYTLFKEIVMSNKDDFPAAFYLKRCIEMDKKTTNKINKQDVDLLGG